MPTRRLSLAAGLAALLCLGLAGLVQGHVEHAFGAYHTALGWLHEPTYVGVENAVQVIVSDDQGKPVADLAAGDLTVTVSVAGKTSAALPLEPTLDPDSGEGTPGEYIASIIPTVPGDYTFHLQGAIHGTPVDESVTASDQTFDPVSSGAEAQFPVALPAVNDLVTRLDRLETRLQAADASAQQALLVGGALGAIGILVGLVAIGLALRSRRAPGA